MCRSCEGQKSDPVTGLVVFGNQGAVRIRLNDTYNASQFSLSLLATDFPNQNTNTSGGLYVMRTQLFEDPTSGVREACFPKVAVLLTDGRSTYDVEKTVPGT